MRKAKDLVPREADRLGTVQGHRDGFGFVIPDDGDQYLFFVDDLRMEEAEESQFLAYIVQAHDAVCYARGTLVVLDKRQQLIEFAVIDKDDEESIICSAELTRDMDDKPIDLTQFEKTLVPKKSIYFSGLFNPLKLSDDKTEDFQSLWDEMRGKVLRRTMGI